MTFPPSLTDANAIRDFLENGPFKHDPGSTVPLRDFRQQFTRWLDCPARQLFWSQKRRVERALESIGYQIGFAPATQAKYGDKLGQFGALAIGNLSGPGSQKIAERPLALDGDYLEPIEL